METVVEDGMDRLRHKHGQCTGEKSELGAARQQARGRCLAGQPQRSAPTGGQVRDKKQAPQDESDAPVFDEQLQPVVVRVHRQTRQTVSAIAQRELVEHVRSRPEPRIQGEHGRRDGEPERFAVGIETQRVETQAHRDALQPDKKSHEQRRSHDGECTRG